MIISRHLDNASIIIVEYMALKNDVFIIKNNEFLNIKIEGD